MKNIPFFRITFCGLTILRLIDNKGRAHLIHWQQIVEYGGFIATRKMMRLFSRDEMAQIGMTTKDFQNLN